MTKEDEGTIGDEIKEIFDKLAAEENYIEQTGDRQVSYKWLANCRLLCAEILRYDNLMRKIAGAYNEFIEGGASSEIVPRMRNNDRLAIQIMDKIQRDCPRAGTLICSMPLHSVRVLIDYCHHLEDKLGVRNEPADLEHFPKPQDVTDAGEANKASP